MNVLALNAKLTGRLAKIGDALQPAVLLAIRLYWGWSFFRTGSGKLMHLDRTTEFFASLGVPLPHLNATIAGAIECSGGLLLLVGLATRVVTLPLMFIMAVAYATADRDALTAIWSDPDKFTGATPFLFLFAVVILFAFGPGRLSLDELLGRLARTHTSR